jgi:hypothetical protein
VRRSGVQSRHSPGMPFRMCVPRSVKVMPDPTITSLTVLDTKTSPGLARFVAQCIILCSAFNLADASCLSPAGLIACKDRDFCDTFPGSWTPLSTCDTLREMKRLGFRFHRMQYSPCRVFVAIPERIDFCILYPCIRQIKVSINRLHGARRLTRATIDTFPRVDVELAVLPSLTLNARHRADAHARLILDVNAWFCNYERHANNPRRVE